MFFIAQLSACGVVQNPFEANDGWYRKACDVDMALPVELERARFTPPEIWLRLKPCEMVSVNRYERTDSWGISAALNYTYGDIAVYGHSMGMGVSGNLNMIGDYPKTLEGWREFEDKKWRKYMSARQARNDREVDFVRRNNLSCWREYLQSYDQNVSTGHSVTYFCWEDNNQHYPPLEIAASIAYQNGKPLYDLDIEKNLIAPVFATLEVKDITREEWDRRMAIFEDKIKEECKRWERRVRDRQAFSEFAIGRLEMCGIDTTRIKREGE